MMFLVFLSAPVSVSLRWEGGRITSHVTLYASLVLRRAMWVPRQPGAAPEACEVAAPATPWRGQLSSLRSQGQALRAGAQPRPVVGREDS